MCDKNKRSPNVGRSAIWTFNTPQDCSFVPTLAVTLWLGWHGVLIAMVLYAILVAEMRANIMGVLTISAILPPQFPFFGVGNEMIQKIRSWIAAETRKYFGLKVTIEDYDALNAINNRDGPGKTAIFACEPHDILGYPVFLFNPSLNILPGRIGETVSILMTGAIFKLPIMKHIFTWLGGYSVDKKIFRDRLARNEACAFVPGGVQEVTLIDSKKPEEIVLYLKDRKGFVKLALERGVPIVPVFFFHMDGSYGYFVPKGRLVTKFARKIGFLPLFFYGRWKIPFGIPYPKKIHVVIGQPINVPCEGSDVCNESVDKYHKKFVNSLVELFENHKVSEGYGNRSLKIM
uniref:Acyltransferase n=1 Tax=Chaetoceros debilis TaxID=122233 RepID=A0A7S3Q080_9STRA